MDLYKHKIQIRHTFLTKIETFTNLKVRPLLICGSTICTELIAINIFMNFKMVVCTELIDFLISSIKDIDPWYDKATTKSLTNLADYRSL